MVGRAIIVSSDTCLASFKHFARKDQCKLSGSLAMCMRELLPSLKVRVGIFKQRPRLHDDGSKKNSYDSLCNIQREGDKHLVGVC